MEKKTILLSIVMMMAVFGPSLIKGNNVTAQLVRSYLYYVGIQNDQSPARGPLRSIDTAWKNWNWNIDHPPVKELVGIVCGDEPARDDTIKKGCKVFDTVAAHYLGGLIEELAKSEAQQMSQVRVLYGGNTYLTYDQVKEMFPAVCSQNRIDTAPACRCLDGIAIDYLINDHRGAVGDHSQGITRDHAQTMCPLSIIDLEIHPSYDEVKMLLPKFCYGNVLPEDIRPLVSNSCNLYKGGTHMVLTDQPRSSPFSTPDLKPFIAYQCKPKDGKSKYKRSCSRLMDKHMELLLQSTTSG